MIGAHSCCAAAKRQLHLAFDTDRSDGPEASSRPDREVQQRRLADPRLTQDHQDPALTSGG